MKIKWKVRSGTEYTGELHSFVSTPNGVFGMVVTEKADGTLGFHMVDSWDLEVVDEKATKV